MRRSGQSRNSATSTATEDHTAARLSSASLPPTRALFRRETGKGFESTKNLNWSDAAHHADLLSRDERSDLKRARRRVPANHLQRIAASWLLGWWLGNLFILFLVAIVVILVGAALLESVEELNEDWVSNYTPSAYVEQLWVSYTYFVDPGTQ